MKPKMSPLTSRVVLLLAAVDFVAYKLSSVPPATQLYLNSLWSYGRCPPLHPDIKYDEDEARQLGWAEAIYTPGMEYILSEMRIKGQEETPLRWFHDAVYGASLYTFNLFELCENKHLPEALQSSTYSDIAEVNIKNDSFGDVINACGQALNEVEQFALHFNDARNRFENELSSSTIELWPPFNGVTRAGAEEWFH